MLLGVFGLLAVVLAGIGVYGVTSYTVSQQTREIGIRMALGAGRGGVLLLVVRQTLTVVGIGLIVGIGGAMLLGRAAQSLLTGTTWLDATTYVATAGVLTVVAAIATLVPAVRATKVDPLVALRTAQRSSMAGVKPGPSAARRASRHLPLRDAYDRAHA